MRVLSIFVAAVGFTAALAGAASAQGRPNSVTLSCGQARGIVASTGAVVMGTGAGTYDRFVNSRAFCTPSERTEPAWVPTRDSAQCFIGYRCEEITDVPWD